MRRKRSTILRGILTIVLLISVFVAPSHGAGTHTIQRGETLAKIAQTYYGDPRKALVLMAFNHIKDSRTLVPGQAIVLPEIRFHRVQPGDTLALIAKKYLNDATKHRGLAHLNHVKDPRSLPQGMMMTIPVEIGYTLKKGDSLSSVAQEYYGDMHAYTLIALYNNIPDPTTLEPGTHLTLPIPDLRILRERKENQSSTQPPSEIPPSRGMPYLDSGVEGYFRGEYLEAVADIQQAISVGLEKREELSKAFRFLAYAYVALDKPERAKDSFRQALEVDPTLELDPVYVSPKIMEVFREAKEGAANPGHED